MDALNSHAAYYLMKPINIDELLRAVTYVREIKEKEKRLEKLVLRTGLPKAEGKITIPSLTVSRCSTQLISSIAKQMTTIRRSF